MINKNQNRYHVTTSFS